MSKNLGQISSIYKSETPPTNKALLWYNVITYEWKHWDGRAWVAIGGDTSTGLEKVTVAGKTGMRVIDAADVAGVNTNALNLDVTAKVTDIGTNSIAIGALPKASGDASIVIGSSHGPDRVVAKASTSVIIGAATSGSMIIEEGSMGSAIIGGKNIKIDRFHLYTAVIAGEDITTKQSHTVYIPTLKFKGYDTNDVIDKKGVEPGTMMYDQQRRIFMRYTGDDWHTESPSGLEHVVEDIYMAPMVGDGVSGSTTFTSGGVEDRTAILVAGLEVFTFALTNGTHIHTKVVSSSLNAAGHTVVIVEDAFPYDMIVFSYPAAPAQNGWNFHRTPATTTGDDAVNLMSSGDASQPNMVYVSGVKYKNYTTAAIAALVAPEVGTVVYDSDKNALQYYNGTTWTGLGGGATSFTPKRFEAYATAGQTAITLEDNVRAATTVSVNGGVLMSNKYKIVDKIITLKTALNKDDEIVVINMGDVYVPPPPPPPEVEIQLLPGETTFGFITNSPFTVEQDGTTVTHPAAPTVVTITGMNDGSFIKIALTDDLPTTTFGFNRVDHILHAKLNSVGKMTSLNSMFFILPSMTTFECDADTSGVTEFYNAWTNCSGLTSFPAIDTSSGTNFNVAWNGCSGLTSFPAIDTSSGTNFSGAWYGCTKLVCIAGPLDFSALRSGNWAFDGCHALTAPATTGTPVRAGNDATAGTWTNPNPCP